MIPPLLPLEPSLKQNTRPVISIGIVQDPIRAEYMVDCLLGTNSSPQFKELRCWTSASSHPWVIKPLTNCSHHRVWESQGGVLGHRDKIWFVDFPFGLLLCCNPFADKPELAYVSLPESCLMLLADLRSRHNLEKRRCVKVSQGKIRYVQSEKGVICLWTLLDSESPKWRLEYKAPLADLWNDETYKTSGLTPGKVPAIALIDPTVRAVVYFLEQDILFAVDMHSKRVLMSKKLEMGSDFYCSSRFLHPWVFQSEDGPGESNKLLSNDLHDQSDSEEDEESDNEDDEDDQDGREESWVCAQGTISAGEAARDYFESQLEAQEQKLSAC